jgi:hypothetical protein
VTTFAVNEDSGHALAALGERERQAWAAYARSTTGLTGSAYDNAERGAWQVLQLMLTEISTRRTELLSAGGRRPLPHR